MGHRGDSANGEVELTARERRLALVIARDADVPLWRAGQLAGYCGASADDPEPDRQAKHYLAKSARRALKRPHVAAEVERLRKAQAAMVRGQERVAVTTEEKVEAAAKQQRLDRLVAEQDSIALGAELLDFKRRGTFSDIRDFAEWDADGTVTVKPSDELTDEQAQLIQKLTFNPRCGECKAQLSPPGVTIELVPKATMSAQASKHLGLDAPRKLEVTGKDGSPLLPGGQERGLSWETVLAVRHAIIGRPVEPAGELEAAE